MDAPLSQPFPPPTVPRDGSPTTLTPPPVSSTNVLERRRVFEPASAPFPTSPSSLKDVSTAVETRTEEQSEEQSEEQPESPVESQTEIRQDVAVSSSTSTSGVGSPSGSVEELKKKKRSLRTCTRLQFFRGHTIAEAGSSMWFDARVLLLLRLAITSMLVSHLIFFSLRRDFSFRLYATWSYAGLTVAFLVALMCSLVQVLRIGDDEEEEQNSEPRDLEQGETRTTTVSDSSHHERKDTGFVYVLAQITVPLYQVFLTAIVFSAVAYWAALRTSESRPFDYPIIALHIAAPGAALVDLFLSMSMGFRFVYAPLFILYNVAYAITLWAINKIDDLYVYQFLDPSVQPRKDFITKCVGLVVATVAASLVPCAISLGRELLLVRLRKRKLDKQEASQSDEATVEDDESGSNENSTPSTESPAVKDGADRGNNNASEDVEDKFALPAGSEDEYEVVDEVGLSLSASNHGGDRRALPPTTQERIPSELSSRRWRRMSAAGRLAQSISQGSLGSSAGEPRTHTSAWDLEIDGLHARPEDEFFRMPAAYNMSGEAEVVKLMPLDRSGSTSGMSRSGSGRGPSRSGSAKAFSRSGSTRSMSKSQSGRGITGKSSGMGPWHSNSWNRIARSSSGSNVTRAQVDRGQRNEDS